MPGLENTIPPPILAAATGTCIYYLGRELPAYIPDAVAATHIHAEFRPWVAGGLAAVGLGLVLPAMFAFRAKKTTVSPLRPQDSSAIVSDGLYGISRNPMYLGLTCALAGFSVYIDAPIAGGVGILAWIALITRLQIIPEERALEAKFGDAYRAYMKKVRRWI